MMKFAMIALGAIFLGGCASEYSWTPMVPSEMRTVAVPTFRNESNVVELGSVMSREVLREFQREGTFVIKRSDDASLEVQGVVKGVAENGESYNRRAGYRTSAYELTAEVDISVIDRKNSRVLVDNRRYVARTTLTVMQDLSTAERDASGRLAVDLAHQVVDDVLNLKW